MGADLYKNAAPSLAGDFRCFSSEEPIEDILLDIHESFNMYEIKW